MLFNALKMSFRELKLRKDPNCPVCGQSVGRPVHHQGQCGSERRHRSQSPERPHPINLLAWEFFTFLRQHRALLP